MVPFHMSGMVWYGILEFNVPLDYVRYGFLSVCYGKFVRKMHRFEIVDFKMP